MVARRVYVPANGNNENATFPSGQYVDLDDAGAAAAATAWVVAAATDLGNVMAIILPEVPIVVVASNICCRVTRLVAKLLGDNGVRNEILLFTSLSSSSCSNFDDTVVDVDKKQSCRCCSVGRVLVAVVGFDINACTGEEANTISGNRNIRWIVARAAIVPSAKLLFLYDILTLWKN